MEILNHIDKLMKDMQQITEEVQRVINHNEFHHFIHGLITDSGPRFRTIVDGSEKYTKIIAKITDRMVSDFSTIEDKTKSFKSCREIN